MFRKKEEDFLQNPEIESIDKEYQRKTFITKWKPILGRYSFRALIAFDILMIAAFIIYMGFYLASGSFSEKRQVARVVENLDAIRALTDARSARSIDIGSVSVFSSTDERYDLFVEISNPNQDWYGRFDYYFTSSAGDSDLMSGFLLPGEERSLVAFSQEFSSRPTGVDVVIEKLEWVDVDSLGISDINAWMAERDQFIVEDAIYNLNQDNEDLFPTTTFRIKNESSFSFWAPQFFIFIERAGRIAAINSVSLSGFESGEARDVELNWFGDIPSGGTVIVLPNIDYLDDEVYMPLTAEAGSDIRDEINDRRR